MKWLFAEPHAATVSRNNPFIIHGLTRLREISRKRSKNFRHNLWLPLEMSWILHNPTVWSFFSFNPESLIPNLRMQDSLDLSCSVRFVPRHPTAFPLCSLRHALRVLGIWRHEYSFFGVSKWEEFSTRKSSTPNSEWAIGCGNLSLVLSHPTRSSFAPKKLCYPTTGGSSDSRRFRDILEVLDAFNDPNVSRSHSWENFGWQKKSLLSSENSSKNWICLIKTIN